MANAWEVDDAKHEGEKGDSEDVYLHQVSIRKHEMGMWRWACLTIAVGEEADTSNGNSPDMIPAERGGIYLSKSKASSGINVLNVCEIVVEVVVGTVTTGSLAIVGNGDTHCWVGCMKRGDETAVD